MEQICPPAEPYMKIMNLSIRYVSNPSLAASQYVQLSLSRTLKVHAGNLDKKGEKK